MISITVCSKYTNFWNFFVSFSFSSLFLFVNHMDVRRHFSLVRQYVATMLFNMLPYCHMRTFFHLFFCLAFIASSFLSFCRWIHWCPNSNRIKEPSLTRIICLLVKKLHITIYIIAGCYRNSDAQRMLVVRISPNRIFAVDDVHLDTMWKFAEFCRFLCIWDLFDIEVISSRDFVRSWFVSRVYGRIKFHSWSSYECSNWKYQLQLYPYYFDAIDKTDQSTTQ